MSEEVKTQVVFEPPSKDEPGYLRRTKRALTLMKGMKADPPDPEVIDEMVVFLLPYVKEPIDREMAEDTLWDLSEAQFLDLMEMMTGNPMNQPGANGKK